MKRRDFLKLGASSYLLAQEAFAGMSDMAMSSDSGSGAKVAASVIKPNSNALPNVMVSPGVPSLTLCGLGIAWDCDCDCEGPMMIGGMCCDRLRTWQKGAGKPVQTRATRAC